MNASTPDQKDDPRRQAILEAAAELFFQNGYGATSIDAIITRAGGSKRTIYAIFGNKQGLFQALVQENACRIFEGMDFGRTEQDLETTLTEFSRRMMRLLVTPRAISVLRIAVSEILHMPELARIFNDMGPLKSHEWLAGVLSDAKARGEIVIADPDDAASRFLGMLRGQTYMEMLLGLAHPPSEAEIDHQAANAVQIFLYGVTPRPPIAP